jgi:hypothetical protein
MQPSMAAHGSRAEPKTPPARPPPASVLALQVPLLLFPKEDP